MQLNFFDVLSNLLGLFVLIAVGYAVTKGGLLPASVSGHFSKLLLKVTLPCTIFTSLLREYDPSFFRDVVTIIVIGLVLFPLNAFISKLLCRLARVPEGKRGVWAFCATFSNTGFMGFPIILALLGEEALALAAMLNFAFNLVVYTLGGAMVYSDRPAVGGKKEKLDLKSVLFTAINVSAILGLIFYFTQLPVPDAVLKPMTHLGNMTTPLSMIVTGMNLSNRKLSEVFGDRDILTSTAARLIAVPLITFAILSAVSLVIPFGNVLLMPVAFIIFSMPTAGVAPILAQTHGADKEFAAGIVFMTSLFCIVTIPVMVMLL